LVDQLPPIFVAALRAAIKDEQQAPTRKNVVKILRQIRSTGEFDEADSLQVGLLEPNFSDRYSRTPQRVRKNADRLLKNYRQERPGKHGRGSGRYFVRHDAIGAPTLCALMISTKFGWPAVTNQQAQEACEKLWAAAGGDVQRRGGTCHSNDGFWRDHLRTARRQWRDTPIARRIQSYL
jgi:hypothetical protein